MQSKCSRFVCFFVVIFELVFLNVCPLDAGFPYFGPEIWILRKKSPLEPDSQVWNRISSLKNLKFIFKSVFLNPFMGLQAARWLPSKVLILCFLNLPGPPKIKNTLGIFFASFPGAIFNVKSRLPVI